jgi:protein TonB
VTAAASTFDIELRPERFEHDRLGFTLLLALAVHALVILGISFSPEQRSRIASRLEITLAQYRSDKAPERADFLAQHDQEGSGTLDKKALLTTRKTADFHDNVIREVSPVPQLISAQRAEQALALVKTARDAPDKAARRPEQAAETRQAQSDMTILQRDQEIASLEAKLDIQRQAYAARPRVRRLTSVATKRAEDAAYLNSWRERIEAIGNRNYPAQARAKQIFGDLRLMVALYPNGEVKEIRVLKSSGQKILDEAAIRIVHMAAPYEPFPQEMSRKVDVLEIIRTWRFHKNRLSSES